MRKYMFLGLAFVLVMACSLTDVQSRSNTGTSAQLLFTKQPLSTHVPTSTPTATTCTVTAQHLNVRACGATTCAVLDTLDNGDRITVITLGDWYEVQTATGAAWLNSKYCKIGEN